MQLQLTVFSMAQAPPPQWWCSLLQGRSLPPIDPLRDSLGTVGSPVVAKVMGH